MTDFTMRKKIEHRFKRRVFFPQKVTGSSKRLKEGMKIEGSFENHYTECLTPPLSAPKTKNISSYV